MLQNVEMLMVWQAHPYTWPDNGLPTGQHDTHQRISPNTPFSLVEVSTALPNRFMHSLNRNSSKVAPLIHMVGGASTNAPSW